MGGRFVSHASRSARFVRLLMTARGLAWASASGNPVSNPSLSLTFRLGEYQPPPLIMAAERTPSTETGQRGSFGEGRLQPGLRSFTDASRSSRIVFSWASILAILVGAIPC